MNESTRFNLYILLNVDSSPTSTSLSTADLWSIGIAFTALLISLFIGGWIIYRDCIDKGRFKIRMGLYEIITTNGTISPSFLEIKITNYGTKPLGLGSSGFLRLDVPLFLK
jgi:hypothetical protein